VPVGTEALTGFELNAPDSHSIVRRQELRTDARISRIGDKVRSYRVRPTLETGGAHHSRESVGVYRVFGDQSPTPRTVVGISAVFSLRGDSSNTFKL